MATLGYIFGIVVAMGFGFMLGAEHPSKAATKAILKGQEAVVKHLTEEVNKYKTLYVDLVRKLKERSEKK